MQKLVHKVSDLFLMASVSLSVFISTNVMATAEDFDLIDATKQVDALTVQAGKTAFNVSLVIAIILAIIGVILFVASTRNNGDNSKTKGAAATFFIGAMIAGAVTVWIDMGSRTFTKQNSQISEILNATQVN
ncbi:hypothetical protein L1D14_25575 [Vibrio tubiashii]|uniref:hypothetical protein n=1 Tax=Vibrio tubiashii TaxID=29498 RepID=UPI001EFD6AF9|nr:hypothetical protein [Vibrio tubiashii]MCG9579582.1 hypothetical protein [Vibrio tubiashii]